MDDKNAALVTSEGGDPWPRSGRAAAGENLFGTRKHTFTAKPTISLERGAKMRKALLFQPIGDRLKSIF